MIVKRNYFKENLYENAKVPKPEAERKDVYIYINVEQNKI
jgi:hypothetical protein